MTTRGSLARGQTEKTFTGRVRHWEKKLVPASAGTEVSRIVLLKWVPTEEKTEGLPGPRYPDLVPVKDAPPKIEQKQQRARVAPDPRKKRAPKFGVADGEQVDALPDASEDDSLVPSASKMTGDVDGSAMERVEDRDATPMDGDAGKSMQPQPPPGDPGPSAGGGTKAGEAGDVDMEEAQT